MTEGFSGGKNYSRRGFLIIFHFYARAFSAVVAPLLTSRLLENYPLGLSVDQILISHGYRTSISSVTLNSGHDRQHMPFLIVRTAKPSPNDSNNCRDR